METTLAKTEQAGALAQAGQINDMFGGGGFKIPIGAPLPQIKILRETPMFETPEEETVKTVTGHIIYWHEANQYYSTEYGEGEQGPPTCSSSDGITPDGGEENQSAACKNCPMNEYGSAKDGSGKACQNTVRMYVLRDGDVIPSIMIAPPSSLGKKESLMKWLTNAANVASKAGAGEMFQVIKATFSLHKKDFDSGFSASVLDIATDQVLKPTDPDEFAYIKKLGQLYKSFMSNYFGRIAEDVATAQDPATAPENNPDITNAPDDAEIPI